MANGKSYRVGVLGCGRVAEHHLKFLSQMRNVDIVGLADVNISQARQLGEKYGIQNSFSSVDELLDFARPDILHIVSPPQHHFEPAVKAIEKGVHVLIEKPITLNYEDTRKLYALAEDRNVKICPDYIHLFNPIILEAKAAIQQNDLGKLIYAESYMSEDLSDPALKESIGRHWSFDLPGGVMQNYITHPLYLVFEWLGKINKVTACPRQFGSLPQGLSDHVDVLVEGEKANGKITMTFAPKYPNYYLKLFFAKGIVIIDFVTQTYTLEKVNGLPRAANRVLVNFSRSRQLMTRSARNVVHFLRKKMVPYHGLKYLIGSFYGWIDGDNVPTVSKTLALDVSEAEESILKSAGKVHFVCLPRESTQKGITKKEKVLITGGTGYVGSEIVRQLVDSGYYVRAYVRETSHTRALEEIGVELVYGDIREAAKVNAAAKGMDVIVHVAAAMKGSKSFMMDCCVNGTSNIAEAACDNNVGRIIYISSFSVYDYFNAGNGTILDEESKLEPQPEKRGTYSLAKRNSEKIALSNLSAGGPAWTIFRPSLIFGNGSDLGSLIGPRIGKFIGSFGRRGKHLKLVHVRDVARAVCLALENESTGNRVYNLSHEDQITVGDMYNKCLRKSPFGECRVVYVPYSLGLAGIAALKVLKGLLGKGPDMNRVRLAYLCRDVLADSSAFRNATGWKEGDKLLAQLSKEIREA
jgi:2-alkyl-3-oxoalkanoate reductase